MRDRAADHLLDAYETAPAHVRMRAVQSLVGATPGTPEWDAARDEVVRLHYALAVKLASPFARPGVEHDDLIQSACLGLMRAAERYDPSKETTFATYATWWVMHFVRLEAGERSTVVRSGRRGLVTCLSIDAAVPGTEGLRIADSLVGEAGGAAELACRENEVIAFTRKHLPPRTAEIVLRRCGIGRAKETLQEVADSLGVTKERIRAIQNTARKKLTPLVEDVQDAA